MKHAEITSFQAGYVVVTETGILLLLTISN
jgi:hypothetical protein